MKFKPAFLRGVISLLTIFGSLSLVPQARAILTPIDTRNPQGIPDITQGATGICAAAAATNLMWNWSEFPPFDNSTGQGRLVDHTSDPAWPGTFTNWSQDSIFLRVSLTNYIYGPIPGENNGYGDKGGMEKYIKSKGFLYSRGFFGGVTNPNGLSVVTVNGNNATYANLYNWLVNAEGKYTFVHVVTNWRWHDPTLNNGAGDFVYNHGKKSRHALMVAGLDIPNAANNDPGNQQILLTNGWGAQHPNASDPAGTTPPVDVRYYDTYNSLVTNSPAGTFRIPAGGGAANGGRGNNYLVHGITNSANCDYVEMYQFVVVKQGGCPDVGVSVQPPSGGTSEYDYMVHNVDPNEERHFFLELDPGVLARLTSPSLSANLSSLVIPPGWAVEVWNPAGTISNPEGSSWDGEDLFAPPYCVQDSDSNVAFTPGWSGLHWYCTGPTGAGIQTGQTVTFGFRLPTAGFLFPSVDCLTVVGEANQGVHYYNIIAGPAAIQRAPAVDTPALPTWGLIALAAALFLFAARMLGRRKMA